MGNVKDVKVKMIPIQLDKRRHLKYDLNAFAELEEHFGTLDAAMEQMQKGSIKAFRIILWAGLIHEDENLTIKQVGAMIDLPTLYDLTKKIEEAMGDALPEPDLNTEAPGN